MTRVDELRELGERLQQSIVLTRIRLGNTANSPLLARGKRTLSIAEESFCRVSEMVQSVQRMREFLNRTFGMDVTDLLDSRVPLDTVKGIGMELLIGKVRGVIDELWRLNAALDEEERKHHGESSEKRAA